MPESTDLFSWLLQVIQELGVVGVTAFALWLMYTGKVISRKAADAESARERELEKEIRSLYQSLLDEKQSQIDFAVNMLLRADRQQQSLRKLIMAMLASDSELPEENDDAEDTRPLDLGFDVTEAIASVTPATC